MQVYELKHNCGSELTRVGQEGQEVYFCTVCDQIYNRCKPTKITTTSCNNLNASYKHVKTYHIFLTGCMTCQKAAFTCDKCYSSVELKIRWPHAKIYECKQCGVLYDDDELMKEIDVLLYNSRLEKGNK